MRQSSMREIIKTLDTLDETLNILCPQFELSDMSTKCILADDNEIEGSVPDGFKYYLAVYEIKDVIENLKQQAKDPDEEVILNAINFYKDKDAFIRL